MQEITKKERVIGKLPTKKDEANFKKLSISIGMAGDLSINQKKFYNAFIYIAERVLDKNTEIRKFAVSLASLKEFFGIRTRNNETLKSSIKGLMRTIVEYNYLNKDKNMVFDRMATLLSEVQIGVKKDGKDGIIEFIFPDMIRESLISEDAIYAKIDLLIIKAFKSKYAIILYELAKDYEKVEIPEMTIEDFRKIFGVENKHKRMSNLKNRVLIPACKEVNSNPKVPFTVEYELLSKTIMNEYTHIKFHVKPKPAKLKLDQQKDKIITQEIQENPDLSVLLALIPEEYRAKKNLIAVVLGGLEEKGKEYTQAQIEYTNKNAKKNYVAYLKKAIEKDYAGVEVIEGAVVEEDNEWKKKYLGKNIRLKGEDGLWEIVFVDEPDDEGICKVRAKNSEGREVWATIRIDNPLLG